MSNDSIGWIKQRADCLALIQEQAPAIWEAVVKAIEADLVEFSNLFPTGPVSVIGRSRPSDQIFEGRFKFNDRDNISQARLVVSFTFKHAGIGIAVIESHWVDRGRAFDKVASATFEISRCVNGVVVLTDAGKQISPQDASREILKDGLFLDGLPSSPR